jgi:hypothetical protein
MQGRLPELVALIVREGGRTQADAVSEVREAIDFCRYYAAQAREKFSQPIPCPARPASATACRCTAAASSSASARGISRWPFCRPGRRGAGRRQHRRRQAGRADAAGRRAGRRAAAQRRHPDQCAGLPARRWPHRRGDGRRPRMCRRGVHRLDRGGAPHRPQPGRQGRPAGAADRRDRRPEHADRRFVGAARTDRPRRRRLGLQLGRATLLGAARAVRPDRHRRPGQCEMLAGAMQELRIGNPADLPPTSVR